MKKREEPTTTSARGCFMLMILFLVVCAAMFGGFKLGYWQGGIDEHDKLFSVQMSDSIQAKKLDFIELINNYRKVNHKQPLTPSIELEKSANATAYAIYTGQHPWNHDGYVASISAQYRGWFIVGENLARNYDNFSYVLKSWELSPEHNKNLLDPEFCEAGIGVVEYVWVLHLGCRS